MKTAMTLTAQDIEIAVARHFGYRENLVVPNVANGWCLRHEADMIVLRPSGLCDEVEIKVTRSDIRADAKKPYGHWENRRVARVWFAVPDTLASCPEIPAAAGILSVMRVTPDLGVYGVLTWREWRPGDTHWRGRVTVVRPAKLRPKADRMPVTDAQRLRLAELGAMRIWDLKLALARSAQRRHEC
jgi:hypothetical protein